MTAGMEEALGDGLTQVLVPTLPFAFHSLCLFLPPRHMETVRNAISWASAQTSWIRRGGAPWSPGGDDAPEVGGPLPEASGVFTSSLRTHLPFGQLSGVTGTTNKWP